METGALFSPNRRYRWRLWRIWDESLPRGVFVVLAPGPADENLDDTQVIACEQHARRWGWGSVEVVAVFARVLYGSPYTLRVGVNPRGSQNDRYLLETCVGADVVVAAWTFFAEARGGAEHTERLLRAAGVELFCFGVSPGDGMPVDVEHRPEDAELKRYVGPWEALALPDL